MILFSALLIASSAITYEVNEGRFADRFQSYVHAKWVSFQSSLPLLYKPFKQSDEFAIPDFEEEWTKEKEALFHQVIPYDGNFSSNTSSLYVVPLFSNCEDDHFLKMPPYFQIDWQNETFVSLIKAAFQPKKVYPNVSIPADVLSVAMHVRKGGGCDPADAQYVWPLRFAPDSFYSESLEIISNLYPGRSIYVHLFTDDLEPLKIVAKFKKALPHLLLEFGCREVGNFHDDHIIEDFLAMLDFDCMIRSQSNFSFIQSKIGQYEVVISPKKVRWIIDAEGRVENYIDEKEISINRRGKN